MKEEKFQRPFITLCTATYYRYKSLIEQYEGRIENLVSGNFIVSFPDKIKANALLTYLVYLEK